MLSLEYFFYTDESQDDMLTLGMRGKKLKVISIQFVLGEVAKKNQVKSVVFLPNRGGGHPGPNSIFEKKGFFSGIP